MSLRKHIHTTISQEHYKKLLKIKEEFGSLSKALEYAIDCVNSKDISGDEEIWLRAKKELNDIIVSKILFKSLVLEDKDPFEENGAKRFILWYLGKSLEEATLEEVVEKWFPAYVKINWFYEMDIQKHNSTYIIYMYHDFCDINISRFFGEYFKSILSKKNVWCSYFITEGSIKIEITDKRF